ncbi:hypothetical protein Acr_02g0009760 [Actinidia rufa]|uniref:Integrase catalytic domain-containing protein n=1 Tax=Actinidia rufa TaxID=165716 RepID=A0A7J0E996_9ERIC|nr:hypothetical protein Acr_02g0009760 [Actinidia rufa]
MVSEQPRSHEHSDLAPVSMAENSQINSASVVSNPAIAAPNSLIAINAAAKLPLKLTPINYLTWRAQFNALLTGYDLMRYVDGFYSEPPKILNKASNPAHLLWLRQDQLLLHSIIASVSEEIMPLIASATTSRMAWEKLNTLYANRSRSRVMSLKEQLTATTRGSSPVGEFLNTMRSISDELSIIGEPPSDIDLVVHVLNGLGPAFKEIAAAIRTRDNPISFEDLHDNLVEYENFLKREEVRAVSPTITAHIVTQRSGQSNTSTPRHYNNNKASSNNRGNQPFSTFNRGYQGSNHAKRCPRIRPDFSTAPTANYTATAPPQPQNWLLDSAASHHVTDDLNNLSLTSTYEGSDAIVIGDSTGLRITHTGNATLPTHSKTFALSNVLYVPSIKKNLLSVSQFCKCNNTSIEFFPAYFLVKDLRTGATLIRGQNDNDVYMWPQSLSPPTHFHALVGVKAPLINWHRWLGNPSSRILHHLVTSCTLPLSPSSSEINCDLCLCNKSQRLPFHESSLKSRDPLDLIYTDVWGPTPVTSTEGYRFYVIFVDHFTKYIWFYPISHKSDVFAIFPKFKVTVENYFKKLIVSTYSDNRGEYITMKEYFATHGITHLTTPPHTPQHNGTAERRHRHIADTGLTMLYQASLPLSFWPHAFQAATYLINRLPTPILHLESPFESLFGDLPNYLKLRVFGCLCYPWLRLHAKHKLDSRSRPCVFLGYSLTQSAYKCLDPITQRIFISRHVRFVESEFPYSTSPYARLSSHSLPNWTSSFDIPPPSLILPSLSSPTPLHLATPVLSPVVLSPHQQHVTVHSRRSSTPCDNLSSPSSPDLSTLPPSSPSPPPPPLPPPVPTHPMITRAKNNIFKPRQLNVTTKHPLPVTLEPSCVSQALQHPKWRAAMSDEFNALARNGTWELVPPSPKQNLFANSKADTSLFIYNHDGIIAYFLVYVDDFLITGNNGCFLASFIAALSSRFSVKDMGTLHYFLGVEVIPTSTGLFLSQHKYIHDLLVRTNMTGANKATTPLSTTTSLTITDRSTSMDASEFRSVVGSLQYLSLTRPDIAFAVNKLSQFMHKPTQLHWQAVKRLLRYLKGTIHHGLSLTGNPSASLYAFSDSDWAGNPDDRTSTTAYILFLGGNAISWASRKQRSVARSSTEAEYRAVAATAAELSWVQHLLGELGALPPTSPMIYCDNVGATYLSANPIFHSRMKHVAIDFHFVRDHVNKGQLRVSHVSTTDQLADALTKTTLSASVYPSSEQDWCLRWKHHLAGAYKSK